MKDWNKYNFVIATISRLDDGVSLEDMFNEEHRAFLTEIFSNYAEVLRKEKPEIKARAALEKGKTKKRRSPEERKKTGEKLRKAREKYISKPKNHLPEGITPTDLVEAGVPRSTAYKYSVGHPMRNTSIARVEAAVKALLADRKRSK